MPHKISFRETLNFILVQKDVKIEMPQLFTLSINDSTPSIHVEFVGDPRWTEFTFITKKKGANGPTKKECKKYYSAK